MSVPYIDYNNLKEFYTGKEVCSLFRISKERLRAKCAKYNTQPCRNEMGEWGLVKCDVRKLYNFLCHENNPGKQQDEEDDPWA